ncbi:MAG: hypothetical protein HOJ41_07675 [Rhodospirillaceae bacterium]|nr:hypothetical protein [Rhodospirillaceae bacterium]
MPDGSYSSALDAAPSHTILDRLPPDILGSLSVEQRAAISVASGDWKNGLHRVNLRLTLPLLSKRWYITVLGGPDRRTAARRKVERAQNPLRTAGNMAFIFVTALTFYSVGAAALLFSSSVLSY